MESVGEQSGGSRSGGQEEAASTAESLQGDFEEFGLSGYEARTLVALVTLGAAPASHIARLSGIGHTSVYPVLQSLAAKGLAEQRPGRQWGSAGREEVINRLYAAQEDRLRELAARRERLRDLLAGLPEAQPSPLPYVHVIRSAAEMLSTYDRLLRSAQSEVLAFNRPPFASLPVNRNVLSALKRGVAVRALYRNRDWVASSEAELRDTWLEYHQAGVDARLVDECPVKMFVIDRRCTLLAMTDQSQPGTGFPTFLLIDNADYGAFSADAFEQRWRDGRPFGGLLGTPGREVAQRERTANPRESVAGI